ncbi:MAG: twitching motility protein PilT [Eubacteriaceae bacterium]|nr:twitching motility protein PilT [Eubacteriaceae bacterium]
MIAFIAGDKGSGKTKKLIDMANFEASKDEMSLVYIDRKENHRREIVNSIRFIDLSEFYIFSWEMFFGFLNGLISGNYDIGKIYIDNIEKIANVDSTEKLDDFFAAASKLSDKYGVEFVFTINSKDIPKQFKDSAK